MGKATRLGGVLIRDATAEDWPAIWPFFRRIVAAGDTYTLPVDLPEDDARAMWMLSPPERTVVAVEDGGAGDGAGGVVVGSAKMGPNHRGPASHIATASFIVAPEHQGRGVGRALGEEVVRWATAEGYRAIQFNAVVEANRPAVALWTSLGWEIVGTLPEGFRHPTEGYVGLHIMLRRLP